VTTVNGYDVTRDPRYAARYEAELEAAAREPLQRGRALDATWVDQAPLPDVDREDTDVPRVRRPRPRRARRRNAVQHDVLPRPKPPADTSSLRLQLPQHRPPVDRSRGKVYRASHRHRRNLFGLWMAMLVAGCLLVGAAVGAAGFAVAVTLLGYW
jgi:hypothetical protein